MDCDRVGTVYMLWTGPYIKLGFSDQVPWQRRLHQIRNATPYTIVVLAARPATYGQEQELHAGAKQWAHPDRPKSDWYIDCPELREYCDKFFYPPEGTLEGVPAMGGGEVPQ